MIKPGNEVRILGLIENHQREITSLLHRLLDRLGLVPDEAAAEAGGEELIVPPGHAPLGSAAPAVKLWEGVALMPRVGTIDPARSRTISENLLEAIAVQEAQVAILDLTDVPVLEAEAARLLLLAVAAARMMGAEVIMTGLSPEAAQTVVRLNVDLKSVRAKGALRAGVAEAFRLIGLQVARSGGGEE